MKNYTGETTSNKEVLNQEILCRIILDKKKEEATEDIKEEEKELHLSHVKQLCCDARCN